MRRPSALDLDRDEDPPRRSSSGRGRRGAYVGALVAVAVGAGAGVTAALLHNRVEAPAPPIAASPPEPKFTSPLPPPAGKRWDEHALEEDGFTLLAGFEQQPAADSPAAIEVRLAAGSGPVTGAQIEIVVQPPAGVEQTVLAQSTELGGRYRAVFDWRASGKYKLRVLASPPGRNVPLELAYDVDARAAQAATAPARLGREPRHPREPAGPDELPITVVPADPVAPVGPRRLQGGSAPPRDVPATPKPDTVVAPPSTTVILPPPVTPTTTVIEPAPPPRRAPRPPPPPREDPPASEPPPSPDPTTLPPPSPDEPR